MNFILKLFLVQNRFDSLSNTINSSLNFFWINIEPDALLFVVNHNRFRVFNVRLFSGYSYFLKPLNLKHLSEDR